MARKNIVKLNETGLRKLISESVKRVLNEAENGGWVVETDEAWDAYEFACNELGKDEMADMLASAMGSEQLAEIMAFIFRVNDMSDWYD